MNYLSTISQSQINKISEAIMPNNIEIEDPQSWALKKAGEEYFRQISEFSFYKSNGNQAGVVSGLKGKLEDPSIHSDMTDWRGIKERFYNVNFDILRKVAERVGPVSAIQTTRIDQLRPFCYPAHNLDEVGFMVRMKDKEATATSEQKKEMRIIEDFFLQSGFTDFPGYKEVKRERKNLYDMVASITREIMTIDQIAISLRRNNKGRVIDFWLLDGATIKRVKRDVGYEGNKKIKYVQEISGKILETFTDQDLIFKYMNHRADIKKVDYGYSYIEMCIDLITSWIWGMTYNKEQFNTSAMPKGFFTFDGGNLQRSDLEELQREWVAMFRGVKGMWRTPFLQHNAKFNPIGPSNKDMEFYKYIQVLESWICSIHGMDPAELGKRYQESQIMIGENKKYDIKYSEDRALKSLLAFHEGWMNDILEEIEEWDIYCLEFCGLEKRDQASEVEIDEKQLNSYMTLNEKRKEKDLDPIENGDVVLNPQFISYIQQKEMAKMGGGETQEGTEESEGKAPSWEVSADDVELEKSFGGKTVAQVGEVRKHSDGFWYKKMADGQWVKLSKDESKAKQYALKLEETKEKPVEKKEKPEIKVGQPVRIKATDKTSLAGGARGIVAKIKEVGEGFVRLVDDAGKIYRVNTMSLEMAKSMIEVNADDVKSDFIEVVFK